jgi:hypothetical protein
MVAFLHEYRAKAGEFSGQNQATMGELENGKFLVQTTTRRDFDEDLQALHCTHDWIAIDSTMDDSERRGSSIQRVV